MPLARVAVLDAATEAGVLVGMGSSDMDSMSGMAASTVELTFGLMLAVMRRIPQADRAMRSGEWPSVLGRSLMGKRLGILGLGRIGRQVAAIARAFGMEILAWGPTLTEERATAEQAAGRWTSPTTTWPRRWCASSNRTSTVTRRESSTRMQ